MSIQRPNPGSAEFVQGVLVGPGRVCPHKPKITPGRGSGVPYRLGFFLTQKSKADSCPWYEEWKKTTLDSLLDDVLNLDNRKLCQACYNTAVPNGFITCSMPYNLEELKEEPQTRRNGTSAAETRRYGNLPAQFVPAPETARQGGIQAYNPRKDGSLKPFLNQVAMPEVLAFFQHLGHPFYMDALHSRKNWDFKATPKEQEKQLKRVYEDNIIVYDNAVTIWVPPGAPALGKSAMAEQRIGRERLKFIPVRWIEAAPGEEINSVDRFSIVPTLPPNNYGYDWSQETYGEKRQLVEETESGIITTAGDGAYWNIDAIPLQEKLDNQIRRAPDVPRSYLSDAQKVIEGWYRGGNVDGIDVNGPIQSQTSLRSKVDDAEMRMTGQRATEPTEIERIRYEDEARRRAMYANKERFLDERERGKRIRKLYKDNGVPEHLLSTDEQLAETEEA